MKCYVGWYILLPFVTTMEDILITSPWSLTVDVQSATKLVVRHHKVCVYVRFTTEVTVVPLQKMLHEVCVYVCLQRSQLFSSKKNAAHV